MSATTEPLMTPKEVATFLGKSKSWVYAACERGDLPSKRVGRSPRFDRAELLKWLDSKSQKPNHPTLKGDQ